MRDQGQGTSLLRKGSMTFGPSRAEEKISRLEDCLTNQATYRATCKYQREGTAKVRDEDESDRDPDDHAIYLPVGALKEA